MREIHHRRDVAERDVSGVQVGVNVRGDLVWRPTPPEVVTDELPHPDQRRLVALGPRETEAAQLSQVRVVNGIGGRDRDAGEQGSANRKGDGQFGQPAR